MTIQEVHVHEVYESFWRRFDGEERVMYKLKGIQVVTWAEIQRRKRAAKAGIEIMKERSADIAAMKAQREAIKRSIL